MTFFARLFGSAWPRAPRSPFADGVAALEKQHFDEALAYFAAALADASNGRERARVENKRALAHLGRGDRCAAIEALTAALASDERCVAVIVNVGNLLLEDGSVDDAIAHYTAALAIDEGYAPAHFNLGVTYKRQGRHAEAVRELRRAHRLGLR